VNVAPALQFRNTVCGLNSGSDVFIVWSGLEVGAFPFSAVSAQSLWKLVFAFVLHESMSHVWDSSPETMLIIYLSDTLRIIDSVSAMLRIVILTTESSFSEFTMLGGGR
jgi:hypothetical protein